MRFAYICQCLKRVLDTISNVYYFYRMCNDVSALKTEDFLMFTVHRVTRRYVLLFWHWINMMQMQMWIRPNANIVQPPVSVGVVRSSAVASFYLIFTVKVDHWRFHLKFEETFTVFRFRWMIFENFSRVFVLSQHEFKSKIDSYDATKKSSSTRSSKEDEKFEKIFYSHFPLSCSIFHWCLCIFTI